MVLGQRNRFTVAEFDPSETHADLFVGIVDELAAAGFTEAREAGRGGFGVVYRCEQAELGRTVAVKVLSAIPDGDNYERFRREEFVMGRLSGHPNIATILQIGSLAGGRPYIVMPFFPGESLHARVRRVGPCEWAWAVRIGIKLAGALETAHRAGVLHRDVKPANVLLTEYADPQLTDFGIARMAGEFETGTGLVAGSVAFTAPEVLGGAAPSVVADVYSLGATLFNLVAGHSAYERKPGEELVAQFLRITSQDIPDLRSQGVPGELADIIEGAMARDPTARPATAAALGEQLCELQRRHGISPDEMAIPSMQVAPSLGGDAGATGEYRPFGGGVSSRHRLPTPLTSFVGRDREVRDIAELLRDDARLVTLTGPGGVGKSRLALQVAARLEPTIPAGVRLVELGNVLEADHLVDAIAGALGLGDERTRTDDPIQDLSRRLATSFGRRRVLLLLDSCEHLIDICGRVTEKLLSAVPGLQLLVTSQQVLGIAGEHIYVVPPLSLPDPADIGEATLEGLMNHEAIQLFVDRAQAVVPGFTMTDADRLDVARLCAELDGIPLVIELAAARLRTFGVTELLQILADRFRLLAAGGAKQPRHRTLQALVDWSYQLLTDDEREIWLVASLFASEFTADAAVEVCAGPLHTAQDVRFILASLVDKSMLASTSRKGIHRYRLLLTLREYAGHRLDESGQRHAAVQRYVNRYQRIADEFRREWFSSRQVEAFTAVHAERENLRAALTYCQVHGQLSAAGATIVSSLHYYWLASTMLTEGRRWLAEVIGSTQVDPPTRARALWSAAMIAVAQDDIDAAREHAGAALEAAGGDSSNAGYVRFAHGLVAICQADVAGGIAELETALRYHQHAADPEGMVATMISLIAAVAQGDDVDRAAELWRDAVALCKQAGEWWNLAYLMYAHGYQLYRLGDLDAAWAAELESVRLSRPFADRIVVAYALEMLSWIAMQRNGFEQSARIRGAAAASWASGDASATRYGAIADQRREMDALLRSALGDGRTGELIDVGAEMGAETIIAAALAEK
jgi:predicted ATPase